MRTLFFATIIGCSPCLASSAPPDKIVQSCLKTESVRGAVYTDIAPASFNVEEDVDRKRTSTTLAYRGHSLGIWESTESADFGLVYNSDTIPLARIVRSGPDAPAPFTPYTAQWGEARDGKTKYLCVTFNFPGLGESGSLQNIRGLYVIEASRKPAQFYYAVGDIRAIKD
jgi:hypothetical protein